MTEQTIEVPIALAKLGVSALLLASKCPDLSWRERRLSYDQGIALNRLVLAAS